MPPDRRPRALVIGGSLGGLFAANLLLRHGWDVDVFEHSGQELAGRGAGGVTVRFANGVETCGDLLIGADGIRSAVRAQLAPEAKPRYAGYVAWRGLADETSFSPAVRRDLFPRFAFCLPPREQMLGYPVAGFTNSTRPGERCYNFVWYRPVEASRELPRLCTDIAGGRHDMSTPPPLIRPELLAEVRRAADSLLSPQFAEVVRHTRQPFFQAIFDLESSRFHDLP
jgi:2-polyprenyl-6-methoxyphenol hydroxylase-like FAD-dependent oxidoreductase